MAEATFGEKTDLGCLLGASCIWAFSFGIIGNALAGVSAAFSAETRLLLAALVFLPFLRKTDPKNAFALMAIGAMQFGLMSLCYMASFRYLPSHEVAIFTVMTPVYVSLLNDAHDRKLHLANLAAAALAVAGAGVILWKSGLSLHRSIIGFLLVEASNVSFAAGQMGYRFWMRRPGAPKADTAVFFWLYLGGAAVLLLPFLSQVSAALPALDAKQALALLYLGVIVSGGSYFLWNKGARNAKPGILAVMNNLKIPLGVTVSLLLFGERAPLLPLLCGGALILSALLLAALAKPIT